MSRTSWLDRADDAGASSRDRDLKHDEQPIMTDVGAMMTDVGVSIVRWVDDEPQPGIVECMLADRFGKEWCFIEKCAVVGDVSLFSDSIYPQPGWIRGYVISTGVDDQKRKFAVVDTEKPWGIEAIGGETRFEVFVDSLGSSPI